ncbi:MAG TPA: hypothetical protein VMW63_00380 [Methanoregulaceae archaeon]|nr:hypothetical protein [Methanoregulaceae archaeon]
MAGNAWYTVPGAKPSTLSRLVVQVMQECKIDITSQYSKAVSDLPCNEFDVIVLLDADHTVPDSLSAGRVLQMDIPDPANLMGTEEGRIAQFRMNRDAIQEEIRKNFQNFRFE